MTVPHGRTAAPRTHPSALATDEHRAEAERTIPRGAGPDDADRTPAVDQGLWLLHVVFARTQDPRALQALVEEYEAYALSIARRFHRDREPIEDLRQIALEALLKSLRRFDPAYGRPFVGFATPTIIGSVKRHYRDHGWALRVPRSAHEMAAPVRTATEELTARLGRRPTDDEVAEAVGVPVGEIRSGATARRARSLVSIDAPVGGDEEGRGLEIPQLEGRFGLVEGRVALQRAMEHLSIRDRTVLGLYFFEEMTQSQIAERFGVSQMQVSRWIRASLARLRSHMDVEPDPTVASAGAA